MARSQQARISFSGGVISPRSSLRADAGIYSQALLTGKNLFITPQGGAVYREGSKLIDSPVADEAFRLFQFHKGGAESDILVEVTAGGLRFRVDDTLTGDTGTNDYVLAELSDLWFTNQERLGILLHPNHAPLYIRQDSAGAITVEALEFSKIPETDYSDEKSPSVAGLDTTYTITFTDFAFPERYLVSYNGVFAETGLPEPRPFEYVFSATDSVQESDIFSALSSISALQGAGTTISAVTTNTTQVEYEVTITGDNAGKTLELFPKNAEEGSIGVEADRALESGKEPAWSFPYVVQNGSNYYRCDVPHLSEAAVNEPGSGSSWADVWTDLGTTAPDWWAWQHGSSNDWADDTVYAPWDRGFPTVAVFHEQRLILAAAPEKTTTIWGSRIGVYDDFIGGSNASDPFEFTLDTSDTPTIRWMQSQLNLMIGTSSGDWNVSAEVSLGPQDISAVRQNGARSYGTKPVTVDTEIYYIEQGQSKLRATRYVRDYQSFSSAEASWLAENLVSGGIKRVVPFYVPEVVLVMLGEDGQLKIMGVNKLAEAMPWSEFETTGTVHDVCAYYDSTRQEEVLYLVTIRAGSYYLEKMPYPSRVFTSGTYVSQGICYLDSWVTGTVSGQQCFGLEHLEGLEVGILVDDAWYGTRTVEDGYVFIDEDRDGEDFAIGLVQEMDLETFEHVTGFPGGIGFGTQRRWPELYCRVLDSSLPLVNGQLTEDRDPDTNMNTPEIRRDGLRDYRMATLGHDNGSIRVQQNRPYPLHVLGFFGRFEANQA